MEEIVVSLKNMTKSYHHKKVIDNTNMTVKKGDIYGLVGKNGAGKTTLMRMICGLSIPTSGEVYLFNETSQEELDKTRKRVGCIIETPSFFPYLSAKKNLEYYRIQRGIVEKNCVDNIIKAVGLEDVGNKKFKKFSLGMKQRLGLALALMASPDLLILDEPVNGLDPTGVIKFREILLKLNKEKNTTIIISSHILSELSQVATTYGFINNGKIIEEISAEKLYEKCRQYLSIKVKNVEKAVVVLEQKLSCKNYRVLNENEIRLYEYINTPEEVVKTFVYNGVMISSINQVGVELEDYFIDLIGGGDDV